MLTFSPTSTSAPKWKDLGANKEFFLNIEALKQLFETLQQFLKYWHCILTDTLVQQYRLFFFSWVCVCVYTERHVCPIVHTTQAH